MRTLPAHPEVMDALSRLRAGGYALAALSELAARRSRRHSSRTQRLTDCFDAILSADTVHALKPRREPYELAARTFAVPIGEMMLVAAHAWDVAGRLAAGCRTAFVARPGMPRNPIDPNPDLDGGRPQRNRRSDPRRLSGRGDVGSDNSRPEEEPMFARVVRFTDVDPDHLAGRVADIEGSEGPPVDIPAKGIRDPPRPGPGHRGRDPALRDGRRHGDRGECARRDGPWRHARDARLDRPLRDQSGAPARAKPALSSARRSARTPTPSPPRTRPVPG